MENQSNNPDILNDHDEDIYDLDGNIVDINAMEYDLSEYETIDEDEVLSAFRYFNNYVNKDTARYPSKWLDHVRRDNVCPVCKGYANEHNQGVISAVYTPNKRVPCVLCNPTNTVCPKCENKRMYRETISRKSAPDYFLDIECSECYRNKDKWRIVCFDLLDIKVRCPKCDSPTIHSHDDDTNGKIKECICTKCSHSFSFKKLYEEEILKERIMRLTMPLFPEFGIGYRKLEVIEKISRPTAKKWVREWLLRLPTYDGFTYKVGK